ncbi:metallophosphoesterase, partial [Microbacterium sp. 13-71-7]|uniref:metallophosphoesterase n=1 Tax=Microbacterium sp. 13-71-7 TaxID=1970399 RepID=UPI0025EA9097
ARCANGSRTGPVMRAYETAETFDLPDEEVIVAGDWHGDGPWVRRAFRAVKSVGGVATVLHVGDFALWDEGYFDVVDRAAQSAHVERVLVTPGNHEHYGKLQPLLDAANGRAVRLSDVVWALPRGFRFTVNGRSVLSAGGAPSVDYAWRRPGKDWWSEEAITDGDISRCATGGHADVMIAHDTVNGSGVFEVEKLLYTNPQGWSAEALEYARIGREKLTRIWDEVAPPLLFHGHYHVRGSGHRTDLGRRTESLAMNGMPGNMVLLRFEDLSVTDVHARD